MRTTSEFGPGERINRTRRTRRCLPYVSVGDARWALAARSLGSEYGGMERLARVGAAFARWDVTSYTLNLLPQDQGSAASARIV